MLNKDILCSTFRNEVVVAEVNERSLSCYEYISIDGNVSQFNEQERQRNQELLPVKYREHYIHYIIMVLFLFEEVRSVRFKFMTVTDT